MNKKDYILKKLSKYEDLSKDVGRVTFPNILPKDTRPDQEIKTFDANKKLQTKEGRPVTASEYEARRVGQKIEKPEDKRPFTIQTSMALNELATRQMSGSENQGMNISAGEKPIASFKSPEDNTKYSPFVAEHEGLHLLIQKLSHKTNIPSDEIYKQMNQNLSRQTRNLIGSALKTHRGYFRPDREYITGLRDALVNEEWRGQVLSGVKDSDKHKMMAHFKRDYQNIRNWAKKLNASDLLQQKAYKEAAAKSTKEFRDYLEKNEDGKFQIDFLNKSEDMPQVCSVAVINGNWLLMGKRKDNSRWTLPGGSLDAGETPTEAALRELFEEAGIKPNDITQLTSEEVTCNDGKVRRINAFVVFGDYPTVTKYDPDDEVHRWFWVNTENGLPKEIAENLHSPKNVVLKAVGLQ